MKFMAVCGSGLGSSFMVQMNIEKDPQGAGGLRHRGPTL